MTVAGSLHTAQCPHLYGERTESWCPERRPSCHPVQDSTVTSGSAATGHKGLGGVVSPLSCPSPGLLSGDRLWKRTEGTKVSGWAGSGRLSSWDPCREAGPLPRALLSPNHPPLRPPAQWPPGLTRPTPTGPLSQPPPPGHSIISPAPRWSLLCLPPAPLQLYLHRGVQV